MAHVLRKDNGGVGGTPRRGTTLSESRDNSLAAQIAKDAAAQANRNNRPTTNNPINTYDGGAAEAARLRAIAEAETAKYKKLINDVTNVGSKLAEASNDLLSAMSELGNSLVGKSYNLIKEAIGIAKEEIDNTLNEINSVGKRANEKIDEYKVEKGNFEEIHPKTKDLQNKNNNTRLSCDTSVLREKVLPCLRYADNLLTDSSYNLSGVPRLKGCEDVSKIPTQVNDAKRNVQGVYNQVAETIEKAERAEKENIGIIEKIGNWIGELLGENDKNNLNNRGNTSTNTGNKVLSGTLMPEFVKNPTGIYKDQQDRSFLELTAKANGIDPNGKLTSVLGDEITVGILAKENGVDTKGKNRGEIIKEIANKEGISTNKTDNEILEEIKRKNSGSDYGSLIKKVDEISGKGQVKGGNQSDKPQDKIQNTKKDFFNKDITYTIDYKDSGKDGGIMPYSLMTPSTVNDGNPKPVIVWLHGVQEGGLDGKTFIKSNYNLTNVISQSKLDNFDAYVISPQLRGKYSLGEWSSEKGKEYLTNLLDEFISEHNVDTNNIVICGGSLGGQGAIYMAANMPEYFSKAVILSGYPCAAEISDIKMPVIGYVERGGVSYNYMTDSFTKQLGEDKLTIMDTSHGKLPEVVFNTDNDGNGRADVIEWMFSDLNNDSSTQNKTNIVQNLDTPELTPNTEQKPVTTKLTLDTELTPDTEQKLDTPK